MNLELFIPELTLAAFAIAVILLDLFIQRKGWLAVVSMAGIVSSRWLHHSHVGGSSHGLSLTICWRWITLPSSSSCSSWALPPWLFWPRRIMSPSSARFQGEYYALVLLSALGMMLMAATTELISIYIALELTSISLYVLVGFLKDPKSTEASLKYLLLGAVASAVLLLRHGAGLRLYRQDTAGRDCPGYSGDVARPTVLASPALSWA